MYPTEGRLRERARPSTALRLSAFLTGIGIHTLKVHIIHSKLNATCETPPDSNISLSFLGRIAPGARTDLEQQRA